MENLDPRTTNTQPPVSVGQWLVTMLICMIPLVNLIMLFVWGFGGGTHPSKANWAKASLIFAAIVVLLYILLGITILKGLSSLM